MESNLSNDLKLIDLSIAIINNDMESAVTIVEDLNSSSEIFLKSEFNLYDLYENNNNNTFKYVLNNLNTYPDIERIRWNISIYNLISDHSKKLLSDQDIIDFINNTLSSTDIFDYQFGGLIRLANIAHSYLSLVAIKNKINNLEGGIV